MLWFVFVVVIRNKVIHHETHESKDEAINFSMANFQAHCPKIWTNVGMRTQKVGPCKRFATHLPNSRFSTSLSVWSEALFAVAARKVAENSKLNLVSLQYRYSEFFFSVPSPHSCWNQFFSINFHFVGWKTKADAISSAHHAPSYIELKTLHWMKWWTDFIWKSSRFAPFLCNIPIYSALWTSAIVTIHCPIHFQV